jgi:hypothetical protein
VFVTTDTHAIIEELLEMASSVLFVSRLCNRADRFCTKTMTVRVQLQKRKKEPSGRERQEV